MLHAAVDEFWRHSFCFPGNPMLRVLKMLMLSLMTIAPQKPSYDLRISRAGVLAGLAGGGVLRAAAGAPWGADAADLLGFPGELMLRLLKMLVLPLVAGSMVAGVCALRGATGAGVGRVARITLAYYAATTATAVALGVLLVVLVQPGAPPWGVQ